MAISYWVIPALSTTLKKPTKKKVDFIIDLVCEKMQVDDRNKIFEDNRRHRIAFARHFIAYILYYGTSYSLTEVGREINRDHTTVLNSLSICRKTWEKNNGYPYYEEFKELLELLSISSPPPPKQPKMRRSKMQMNCTP